VAIDQSESSIPESRVIEKGYLCTYDYIQIQRRHNYSNCPGEWGVYLYAVAE